MDVVNSNSSERFFHGSTLHEGVLSFYVFVVMVIVLAIILGQSELSGANPGYNIYDCKHSISSCKIVFGNVVTVH